MIGTPITLAWIALPADWRPTMARKRTGKPAMPATEVELKFVRLQLPEDDHLKLRRLAADAGTNMAVFTRRIVQEYLAKHMPKGGKS